jgi:hypothetical protein
MCKKMLQFQEAECDIATDVTFTKITQCLANRFLVKNHNHIAENQKQVINIPYIIINL